MKFQCRRTFALLPLIGLIALALGVLCCDRGNGQAQLFPGAKPFGLANAAPGSTPSPQELDALIAAMIDVAGGAGRLKRLSWRRREDLYLSQTGNLSGNRVFCTTLTRPDDSVSTLLEYLDGTCERRVRFRGEEYLQPNSMRAGERAGEVPAVELRIATGGSQQYVEWDWELARLPYLLSEAASLVALPTRSVEGRTLVGMKVDVAEINPKFEAWIDVAGPVVVEVSAAMPITADLSLATSAVQVQRFSDFRRVDGVLFPFRRDLLIGDQRFGLGEARSIEVDVELADADFGFP